MIELKAILERQGKWQKALRHLPWSEKVRMAATLRDFVVQLRRSVPTSRALGSEKNQPKGGK